MYLVKMALTKTFFFVHAYFWFVSLQGHYHVLGEFCSAAQQQAGEEYKAPDVGISSCHIKTDIDKRNVLEYSINSIKVETGIDFMENGLNQLDLDADLYFGTSPEAIVRHTKISTWDLVQHFIRSIKGLPNPEQHVDLHHPIGSGGSIRDKPAWCFFPFLLKELAKVELKIYKILKQFYMEESKSEPFPALESYFKDIEESSLKVNLSMVPEEPENVTDTDEDPFLYIATHPLLIYRLIHRFAVDLQPILYRLNDYEELINSLYEIANPTLLVFPTSADLDDALESIRRMQKGNMMDTYDLARGKLGNVNTGIQMNALHAIEVGTFYLENKVYDFAVQWLHFALETVEKSPLVEAYPEIKLFFEDQLQMAVTEHNSNFESKSKDLWYNDVFNATITLPFDPMAYVTMAEVLKPSASLDRFKTNWNWATKMNFRRVCSGEYLQTEAQRAMLKCWHHKTPNLYWTINPLKAELLNLNPPVFQIYDFIGESLMKKMKSTAAPQQERSMVVDSLNPTGSKVDSTRTSSQTWLYDNFEEDFMLPLTRKMELMSGLTIMPPSACDAYQVASYGPSHHYETHIDSFEDPRRTIEKGNRITTIMGYLSNVEVGGRTGFPVFGIFAEPVKGSIVMWDNLKRNGEQRDERTWHGGCPVVLGVKWITNKWVFYNDNAFNFQCTLNPDE